MKKRSNRSYRQNEAGKQYFFAKSAQYANRIKSIKAKGGLMAMIRGHNKDTEVKDG